MDQINEYYEEYANWYYEKYIAPLDKTEGHKNLTEIINYLKEALELTLAQSPDHTQPLIPWMSHGVGKKVHNMTVLMDLFYKLGVMSYFRSVMSRKIGSKNISLSTIQDFIDHLKQLIGLFMKNIKTSADTQLTRNINQLDENKLINYIADIITEDPNIGPY